MQRIVEDIEAVDVGGGATLFDMRNHDTDLKIDAMFFSCTQDKLAVLGEEFRGHYGSEEGQKEYVQDEAAL